LFYFEKLNAIFKIDWRLGLLIMSAGGFSAYMTHIGAIDVLIDLTLHPLKRIPSPYVVGAGVFIIGNFLQMFITSAAGLGVLLMAMAFPVMRKLGLSIRSSAGFVVMTGVSEFGPTQANAIFAAEQAKMAVLDYVIQYQAVVVGSDCW
jgi:DcuC family C4-dicarboxylate transporter